MEKVHFVYSNLGQFSLLEPSKSKDLLCLPMYIVSQPELIPGFTVGTIGYFIIKGATKENGKLMLKSLNSSIVYGKEVS